MRAKALCWLTDMDGFPAQPDPAVHRRGDRTAVITVGADLTMRPEDTHVRAVFVAGAHAVLPHGRDHSALTTGG